MLNTRFQTCVRSWSRKARMWRRATSSPTAPNHLEIIVKQMFSRISVVSAGDTGVSAGEILADFKYEQLNAEAKAAGQEAAKGKQLLLGITEVSLTPASFLSAISFQNTPRKLAEAAVGGAVDRLG